MGRPERPIDPEAGSLQRFAFELRQLRHAAGGPGYRKLARRAHYSVTALSEAAGGEEFPTLAVTLAYVGACGGDPETWEARWRSVAAELSANGRLSAGVGAPDEEELEELPYLGLAAFQPEDAERFFGRERLIDELLGRMAEKQFLAVFGASGSGKSSLLRAGLIPSIRAGRLAGSESWPRRCCSPRERTRWRSWRAAWGRCKPPPPAGCRMISRRTPAASSRRSAAYSPPCPGRRRR